jgi:zinc/manganese transport system substrate-binding protein
MPARLQTLVVALACALLPMLAARVDAAPSPPLRVVVTNSILADLVQRVAGDRVEMTVLVGRNGDAHSYEPVPRDAVRLREAALVFENGLGFEAWIADLVAASGSKAVRVVTTRAVKVRQPEPGRSACSHGHHSCGGDQDPHVWHDVANVQLMVDAIAEALATADPAHASSYLRNRDAFVAELRALDAWILERVGAIPPERRVIVTGHDTFGYFADRYGFRSVNILGSVTTNVADPSASDLAKVIGEVRSLGVPTIFTENVLNPKTIELVARQAGVKVGRLYTDALGDEGGPAATYISLMRHNVTTLTDALR